MELGLVEGHTKVKTSGLLGVSMFCSVKLELFSLNED